MTRAAKITCLPLPLEDSERQESWPSICTTFTMRGAPRKAGFISPYRKEKNYKLIFRDGRSRCFPAGIVSRDLPSVQEASYFFHRHHQIFPPLPHCLQNGDDLFSPYRSQVVTVKRSFYLIQLLRRLSDWSTLGSKTMISQAVITMPATCLFLQAPMIGKDQNLRNAQFFYLK